MDTNSLNWSNPSFPIKNADGSPFHNLVLHKAVFDSTVMSLGDKITGEVVYRDNTLDVTMQEYIEYKRNDDDDVVRYVLVNPPTIIREGMASDNSELKGMTKYSFEFYHPMYQLSNIPFTDVAVKTGEERYLAQNKTFSWIGNLRDYIDKLNRNLQGTQWIVVLNEETVPQDQRNKLSEVLSFDKNFVSEALKTAFDTWEVPFVIDSLHPSEYYDSAGNDYYEEGKRFFVLFGLPSNEIVDSDEQPFVFKMGQGVGLKNNSRTPKNNKIITRIVGYGSENNIPYGYPQIVWYGDQDWDYTINNQSGMQPVVVGGKTIQAMSYPIYKGIVGGQYVKLIKHPFTRTTLQPSIYSQTVFNKVSPYLSDGTTNPDYNPDIDILDYYDANDDTRFPNPINLQAPSVEIHQFEDIKPEFTEHSIVDAQAYDKENEQYKTYEWFIAYLNTKISETSGNEFYVLSALRDTLTSSQRTPISKEMGYNGGSYTYSYTITSDDYFWTIKYTSDNVNFAYKVLYAQNPPEPVWDDTMDDDGKYKQQYFKMTLPQLDFDLYACAAITQKMQINMRSGACMGCTFTVMVDWEDYKKNFYKDVDGEAVFDPVIHTTDGDGHVRDGEKYPDSSDGSIELILQKDIETFGRIMPNIYQQPKSGDLFVILGISLPLSYITSAENRLDDDMMEYMLENNVYYYEYPLKFDEHFLATHEDILKQMRNNTIVRFEFAGVPNILYIKQMTIKYEESSLPRYDITLTDDVEIVLNQIGQVTDDVSRMRVQVNELQKYYGGGVDGRLNEKLSRISDDVALGKITFQQGLDSIASAIFHDELRSPQFTSGLYAGRGWKIDHLGNAEFESLRVRSFLEVVELLVNRMQAQEGDTLFTDNDQIEKVEKVEKNGNVSYILSLKEKWGGYVTAQQYGNILKGIINTLAAQQSGVSHETTELLYYTSWMRVVDTHNTDNTLKLNQIRVVLYGDDETPAQKNFEPCELMTIARWGNILNPDEQGIDENEKKRRRGLQSSFYISTSEGRIVKLNGVDQPILKNGNYGTTLGELPDFVKAYTSVAERLVEGGDYLYAQGVVVGDFIKINKEGLPVPTVVFCGEWVDGSKVQNPTPRNGIYYYNQWNDYAQQYEIHEVRHNGCRWQCLQSQPVINGGVATYYEPKWNSDYWMLVDGSDTYDIVSSKGSAVIDAAATTMNFSASISFYVRKGGSRVAYDGYYMVYKRSNERYESIQKLSGSGKTFTLTYNDVVCDAFEIRLFDKATKKNRLAEFEIPVIKNGAKGDDGSTTNPNILVDTLEYKDKSKWFNLYSIKANESYQGRVVREWHDGVPKNDGTYVRLAEQAIATNNAMRINPSMWYTLSVYARGNGSLMLAILQGRWNCASYIDANGNEQEVTQTTSDISITHTLTNEWKVYSFTFKTRDTIDVSTAAHYDYASIRLDNITSQSLIHFSMPKLEVGKVATAYIPNEEDLVGADGIGIRSVTKTRQFTLNFSEPLPTDSGWIAATDQTVQTNKLSSVNRYLWEKTVTEYTDTSVAATTDIALIAQYSDGTHENILSGTQFLNQRDLARWERALGSIDSNNTYDGRNSFRYTPDVHTDNAGSSFVYDFLLSKAISGKLKPNTWYTFSFYLRIGNLLRVVGSATEIGTNKYYYVNQVSDRKLYVHIKKNSNSAAVTMNVDMNRSDSGNTDWTALSSYQIESNDLITIKISEVTYNRHIRIHFSGFTGSFTCDYLALDAGSKVSSFVYPNAADTQVQYADGKKITSSGTWLGDSVSTTDQGVVIEPSLHNGSLVYNGNDTNVEWQGQWDWKRHSITFKTPSSLNDNIKVLFRDLWHSSSIYIAMPKLEEGTIATEYVPANEDMKGDMGRNLYYAGDWDVIKGTWFEATDYQAPYVRTESKNGTQTCYVFVGSNGTYQYPSNVEGYTGSNVVDWAVMTSDFKYLITQAVFAAFAHLGSAIFNGDFMFSQHGTKNGSSSTKYQDFDPSNPYDEKNHFRPKFMLNLLQGIVSTSHLVTPFFHITSSNFNTVFENRTPGSGYYVCEIDDDKIAEYGANFALDGVPDGTPSSGILIKWTNPPEGVIVTLANNVPNRGISISTSLAYGVVSVSIGEVKRAMAVMQNGNIIFVEI